MHATRLGSDRACDDKQNPALKRKDELDMDDEDAEQCAHEWENRFAGDDPENISCMHCGVRRMHKFLVVDPDGTVTIIDDPEEDTMRDRLLHRTVGDVTDSRKIEGNTYACVHDTGRLIGLKMQRRRLLQGLAGFVFLGVDTGREFRGFDALERSVIEDMLDDAGLMTEQEAERYRAS